MIGIGKLIGNISILVSFRLSQHFPGRRTMFFPGSAFFPPSSLPNRMESWKYPIGVWRKRNRFIPTFPLFPWFCCIRMLHFYFEQLPLQKVSRAFGKIVAARPSHPCIFILMGRLNEVLQYAILTPLRMGVFCGRALSYTHGTEAQLRRAVKPRAKYPTHPIPISPYVMLFFWMSFRPCGFS